MKEECPHTVRIKVLVDWRQRSFMPRMPTSPARAGLSLYVEAELNHSRLRILFDTSTSWKLLKASMERLKVDPRSLNAIILSHWHVDHSGGLPSLMRHSSAYVYVPPPGSRLNPLDGFTYVRLPRKPITVWGPLILGSCVYVTGPLEDYFPYPPFKVREQALAVKLSDGRLIVLLGCSHPRPARLVRRALEVSKATTVALVIGGLHTMFPSTSVESEERVRELKSLPIERIAAIHCSGVLGLKLVEKYFPGRSLDVMAGDELVLKAGSNVVEHLRGG